jgi:branched-subunit amino acid transport protein
VTLWLLILLAGALTFATRLSFIALLDRLRLPAWFGRALRFVPLAVLPAIILPETATRGGVLDLSWRNPQLLAGALAVVVAWRTGSALLTIGAGLLALLAAQALLGIR